MQFLFDGAKEFREVDFEKNRSLYERLSSVQKPHTLFIGCADSRIIPNALTNTQAGELFVVRNVANIVPHYRASSEFLATTSAIEYALIVLDIKNIIVCGHSNCGGCRSLFLNEAELSRIPHTRKWLELAKAAKNRAEAITKVLGVDSGLEWLVEQENIVEQMNHLMTYPLVEERYAKGELNIYGWYYEIGTGAVYNYNAQNQVFELIK